MTNEEMLAHAIEVQTSVLKACKEAGVLLQPLQGAKYTDSDSGEVVHPGQVALSNLKDGEQKLAAIETLDEFNTQLTDARMALGRASDATAACGNDTDSFGPQDKKVVAAARKFDEINPPLFELSKELDNHKKEAGGGSDGSITGEVDRPLDVEG